jgi:hypothetical protein
VTLESDLFWFRTRDDLLEEWGYGIGRLVEIPESCIALALLDDDRNEFLGPCTPGALASPDLSNATASSAPLFGASPA